MNATKAKRLPRVDLDQIARACRYWNDERGLPDITLVRGGKALRIPLAGGGSVVEVSMATYARGVRRCAAIAVREALTFGVGEPERWLTTIHGKGRIPTDCAAWLADPDDNDVDSIVQMGAFGCLIFG